MQNNRNEQLSFLEIYGCSEFIEKIEEIIHKSNNDQKKYSLFTTEIRNLSAITSVYGNEYAKKIMDHLHQYLRDTFSNEAIIERTGGKYFCLFFSDCDLKRARERARVIHNTAKSFYFNNQYIHLHQLIGSIIIPDDENNIVKALEKSYIALKNIRLDLSRYYMSFSAVQKQLPKLKEQFEKVSYFKDMIVKRNIKLFYQPIFDSKTREIAYYECLLRIINNGEIISAGSYIALAEQMKFVDMIDETVLDMVNQKLAENPNIKLSFNVSSISVYNDEWIRKAKKYFNDNEKSKRVIVEITETAIVQDINKATVFLNQLRSMGCKVAIDDFGAGFTSFSQIPTLPVDAIKIDGMYIKNILNNGNSRLFVETILKMEKKNKNTVLVAECVESEEIADLLTKIGIEYLQGNYLSPPLPEIKL